MEMKQTMKLNRLALVIAALAMMVFAVAVSADEDVPAISDGRINSTDIAAPVAIYPYYSYPYADDVNMGVLDTIDFWGKVWDGDEFEKIMSVTSAEIAAADTSSGEAALIASNFGYALYKETDGSLTLVAPPDFEGKGYQFNWEQSL